MDVGVTAGLTPVDDLRAASADKARASESSTLCEMEYR